MRGKENDSNLQVSDIGRLLVKSFSHQSHSQMLCPFCCSSDLFVRSGIVHVFERDEVESNRMLLCSRFHKMPSSYVSDVCEVEFRQDSIPLMFPGVIEKLRGLNWSVVSGGGVVGECTDDDAARSTRDKLILHDEENCARFRVGTFFAMSFFVETGQVDAGDCLHSDDLQRFGNLVTECEHASAKVLVHTVQLSDGREINLQFRFKVGDVPAIPGGRKIVSIHAADIGDSLTETPSLSSFSSLDHVLVIFEKLPDIDKSTPFKVFAGCRNNLRLCRLTPASCSTSIHAACCWSDLQDYFAIAMGPEFQNYEITALTLFRNDNRARAFLQHMSNMQLRRRQAKPPWEDRGRVAADAVASLGGGELARYKTIFEGGQFDWVRARTMTDEALKRELKWLGVGKAHVDAVLACVKQLQYTFDAQEATMRHFKDHAGKFGLLDKKEDVNLTLAWWGNWRGNAV
jgi:hypothetical protein